MRDHFDKVTFIITLSAVDIQIFPPVPVVLFLVYSYYIKWTKYCCTNSKRVSTIFVIFKKISLIQNIGTSYFYEKYINVKCFETNNAYQTWIPFCSCCYLLGVSYLLRVSMKKILKKCFL